MIRGILYLVFGLLTTLANMVTFAFARRFLSVTGASIVAWFVSVGLAYVLNRKAVFGSEATGLSEIARECVSFFASRLATGVIDVVLVTALVVAGAPEMWSKFGSNVVVVILNFVFGLFVFRSR